MNSTNGSRALPDHEVVVIGAGFGGIGAGVALRRAGVEDFVIIDKWPKVGGTWLANTYPGVAVDIPSPVYNFSFQPRSHWSRFFAPGVELQRYAEEVVDRQGLRGKLRLGSGAVRGAPARSCTVPGGITSTTIGASGWRSSGPGPRRCS